MAYIYISPKTVILFLFIPNTLQNIPIFLLMLMTWMIRIISGGHRDPRSFIISLRKAILFRFPCVFLIIPWAMSFLQTVPMRLLFPLQKTPFGFSLKDTG